MNCYAIMLSWYLEFTSSLCYKDNVFTFKTFLPNWDVLPDRTVSSASVTEDLV